jgi:hypothetical protein
MVKQPTGGGGEWQLQFLELFPFPATNTVSVAIYSSSVVIDSSNRVGHIHFTLNGNPTGSGAPEYLDPSRCGTVTIRAAARLQTTPSGRCPTRGGWDGAVYS